MILYVKKKKMSLFEKYSDKERETEISYLQMLSYIP